jgi:hypothetical protein
MVSTYFWRSSRWRRFFRATTVMPAMTEHGQITRQEQTIKANRLEQPRAWAGPQGHRRGEAVCCEENGVAVLAKLSQRRVAMTGMCSCASLTRSRLTQGPAPRTVERLKVSLMRLLGGVTSLSRVKRVGSDSALMLFF